MLSRLNTYILEFSKFHKLWMFLKPSKNGQKKVYKYCLLRIYHIVILFLLYNRVIYFSNKPLYDNNQRHSYTWISRIKQRCKNWCIKNFYTPILLCHPYDVRTTIEIFHKVICTNGHMVNKIGVKTHILWFFNTNFDCYLSDFYTIFTPFLANNFDRFHAKPLRDKGLCALRIPQALKIWVNRQYQHFVIYLIPCRCSVIDTFLHFFTNEISRYFFNLTPILTPFPPYPP